MLASLSKMPKETRNKKQETKNKKQETRNKKQETETKDAETETVSSSLDHVIQLITSKTEEIQNSIDGKLTEEIRKLNKQL